MSDPLHGDAEDILQSWFLRPHSECVHVVALNIAVYYVY